MTHEQKFLQALKDVFIGTPVEGESGYINLMRIKARYFEQGIATRLLADVRAALAPFPTFREELFDKLYSFFHRYFSESGSIYFRYTPLHQNVYARVYTDDRDVITDEGTPIFLKALEAMNTNHVYLFMEGLGHSFSYGYDNRLGVDRHRLVNDFFDRYLNLQMSDQQKIRAGKISAFVVGAMAIVLGIVFKGVNVTFLVGLAFAVAASANA